MGISYDAELLVAVPLDLNELILSESFEYSCSNGHKYDIQNIPNFCSLCGRKVEKRSGGKLPTPQYAKYIEDMNFNEEFVFEVMEDVLTNSTLNRKLTPRLHCISPSWSYMSNIPTDNCGFGISLFIMDIRNGNEKSKNSLTQEEITKYFDIVRNVAVRLNLKNTEPRIYMSISAS